MASNWQLTLRNFFIIVLKNAINALIVNVGAWWILPANFNPHNTAAIWNIAKLAGVTVFSRELAVWIPVLLKWSQPNAQPTELQDKLEVAEIASKSAAQQATKAADAVAGAKEVAPQAPNAPKS
jgi:hypothetical protein